jgi:hypothetical protein
MLVGPTTSSSRRESEPRIWTKSCGNRIRS